MELMMKKLMAVLTLLMAMTAPQAAQAWDDVPEGIYVGGFGAVSFAQTKKEHDSNNKLRTGYFFSGAVGYRFCEGIRAELEGGYHHNRAKKHHSDSDNSRGSLNTWSILVNGLYDIPTCWCVKPFVGA